MRTFYKRNFQNTVLIILVVAICLWVFGPVRFLVQSRKRPSTANIEGEGNVAVFVIDSVSDTLQEDRNTLDLFEDLTHGDVVCSLVRSCGNPQKLYFYNVDNIWGVVDNRKYLETLERIRMYVQQNPGMRVVVNISLGSHTLNYLEMLLIKDIIGRNVIVVAAAGNDGMKESDYPAMFDGVICVGASENDAKTSYSNYGSIDVFAAGDYHTSRSITLPSDTGYETRTRKVKLSGTSFAAPRVSGLIVKMLQLDPTLSNKEVVGIIQRTSDPVRGFESGSVNRLDALAEISGKYAAMKKAKNAFFVILIAACVIAAALVALFIIVRIGRVIFRIFFPGWWMNIRIRKINEIMARSRQEPKGIGFIIDCLYPGYDKLYIVAEKALLKIGPPAVTYLKEKYHYAKRNDFVDFKAPIKRVIEKIGGEEAERFLDPWRHY